MVLSIIVIIIVAIVVTVCLGLTLGPVYLYILLGLGAIVAVGSPIWLFYTGEAEKGWVMIAFEGLLALNVSVIPFVPVLYILTIPLNIYFCGYLIVIFTGKKLA